MLWPKVDFMVHLGLRPWWTARCADPPLCSVPRLDGLDHLDFLNQLVQLVWVVSLRMCS